MNLKPYKQTLSHSCLCAALMTLAQGIKGKKANQRIEREITLKGSSRKYKFYVAGVPFEFTNYYQLGLKVYVNNKFFAKQLKIALRKDKKIKVEQHTIEIDLIAKLTCESPVICHIDDHYLGDYSHASHFIIIESISGSKVNIIDPYYGKRRTITKNKLIDSIKSLKTHIKMCPLLYQLA